MLRIPVSDQAHDWPAAANRNCAANGMPLTAPAKDRPAGGGLPAEGLRSVTEGIACLVQCQSSDHWLANGSCVKVFSTSEWGTSAPGSKACSESEATHTALSCEDTCSSMAPSIFLTAVVANTSEYISLVQSDSPTLGTSFLHPERVNNSDKWDMIVDSALFPSEIEAGSLVVHIETTCEMRAGRVSRHVEMKNRLVVVWTHLRHHCLEATSAQTPEDAIAWSTNFIE
jgi:hypothetical protein